MTKKRTFLTAVLLLLGTVWAAAGARAESGNYCCVCTQCQSQVAAMCVNVARVIGADQADCPNACNLNQCQTAGRVLEGRCPASPADCLALFEARRAPALSAPVAAGVAVLLLGVGTYLLRRRRAGRTFA